LITAKILYSSIFAGDRQDRTALTKAPAVSGLISKKQLPSLQADFAQKPFLEVRNALWEFLGGEFRLLLLFLLIMAAFPRGTPLTKRTKIKI
jgi:hypothetical protein